MIYSKFPGLKESDNIFYVKPGKVNITLPETFSNTLSGSTYYINREFGFLDWRPGTVEYETYCLETLERNGFKKHGMMRENVNETFSDGQNKGNEDQQSKKIDIEAENANATAENIINSLDIDNQICCVAIYDSKNGMIKIHLNVKLRCNPSTPGSKKPFIKYTVNEDRFLIGSYAIVDINSPPDNGTSIVVTETGDIK